MKNSKILLIALFVVIFIIGLCFCTQVKAAGTTYFEISADDQTNKANAFVQLRTPEGTLYMATKNANLKIGVRESGILVEDLAPFKLSTDKENVAKIDAETGEITILSEGEFSVLADGKVEVKVKVISNEDMKKFWDTNEKANKIMDNIQIENEEKTAGLIYCSPFEEGCMMGIATLQLTDMYGRNFAETFPDVTYEVLDNNLLSIDKNGKITGNKDITKGGETEIFINFGNNVYKSFFMSVVYGWDGYLSWRDANGFPEIGGNGTPSTTEPSTTTPSTTPEQTPSATPTENQPQTSKPAKGDELDDEPKAGINTSVEFFVSGLAIISLAVAVIAKKH